MREPSSPPTTIRDVFLSVIIPAFDEVDRIGSTVKHVLAFLDSRPYESEVIIVLDGGRPGAADEIARAANGRPAIVVLDNGRNRGKGFSVRRGVAASRGDYVLFADADLSLPIEGTDRFLEALDKGAELAIGSRALDESAERGVRQPMRHWLGRAFNWVVQRTALPGLRDTQCGFKAFSGQVARKLFRVQRIDGFGFDVEILYIARRTGHSIVEVPVSCEYHSSSSVRRFRDGASMLGDLIAIRWNDWRGRYDEH